MRKAILKMCIEELDKNKPRHDYIMGMLQALYALDDSVQEKQIIVNDIKAPVAKVEAIAPIEPQPMVKRPPLIPPGMLGMMTPHDQPGAAVERRVA